MKKTLIALMALAGVACGFENVELTFDGTLADGFTWMTIPSSGEYATQGGSPTYVDSGLEGYGKAIVFDKSGFVSTSGDYKTIASGSVTTDADFSVVTTVKFDSWSEFVATGSTENAFYLFGSGDKWNGLGWRVTQDRNDDGSILYDTASMCITLKGKSHHFSGSSSSLELDTWYTLALSYSADTNTSTIYVNGESVGTITLTDTQAANAPSEGLGIGNSCKSYISGPWAGQMADFKLFNSALTAEQVAAYGAPVAAPAIPEPATATLSLLALAGLASRRRRK